MIKLIHGSEDSLDLDVVYVFDEIPSLEEAKIFCSDNSIENKNIITIKDGVVNWCYKGKIDELNNSLLRTYFLHNQFSPIPINKKVNRNKGQKYISTIRCILSHLSRTIYREEVKKALKSNDLKYKLSILKTINFDIIDDFGKKGSKEDVYKIISFQLGQSLGLLNNLELYTKSEIKNFLPYLENYLYRKEIIDKSILNLHLRIFISSIENEFVQNEDFISFNFEDYKINIKTEKIT